MRDLAGSASRWERLIARVLAQPRTLWAVLGIALLAALALLPRLRSEVGVSTFFDPRHPLRQQADEIERRFVHDDLLFLAYEADDVFAAAALVAVRALDGAVSDLRGAASGRGAGRALVENVRSLTTVDDLVGSDASFRATRLVPTPVPDAPQALRAIRARARNNPLIRDHLLGRTDRHAAVIVRLTAGLSDEDKAIAVRGLRALAAAHAGRGPLRRIEVGGRPALEHDWAVAQIGDVVRFTPLVYLLLSALLFLFLRSWRGVLVALGNVLLALVSAMAVLVATGGSLTNASVMLPPAIMALNVALLLHFFTEMTFLARSVTGPDLAVRALGRLLPPMFAAEVTTALGFIGLAATNIPAIREFGAAAAVAVMVAFAISSLSLGLVARRWRPGRFVSPRGLVVAPWFTRLLARITEATIRRRGVVLAVGAAVAIASAVGVARVKVDENDLEFFRRDAPIRRATTFMEEHLAGTGVVVAVVEAPRPGQFVEPGELRQVEAAAGAMHRLFAADNVLAAPDFIKLMHREMWDGAPGQHRLPDTAAQVAQLLLINTDDTISEYLDPGRQAVRLVARTNVHSAMRLQAGYRALDLELGRLFPAAAGYRVRAAADTRLMATLVEELAAGQVVSNLVGSLPVVLIIFVMLRSLGLGVLSLIPNVLPIFVCFGLMGFTGIRLSTATVMIAAVAFGIVVDDTVHFLHEVRHHLAAGAPMAAAVRATMETKAPGMVATTLMIALVFAVLTFSSFAPTRDFALLMVVIMVAALAGDLLLLPATLTALGQSPRITRWLGGRPPWGPRP